MGGVVKQEKSGWRDEKISLKHRDWGFDCPCVDIDFLMLEYNHSIPVGIIEYKDKRAMMPSLNSPSIRAICALANGYTRGPLPFAIVRYCSDLWWFEVHPVNEAARKWCRELAGVRIPEQRFVRGLYRLRNGDDPVFSREVWTEVLSKLKTYF